jgi:hypothetical protein
MEQLNLNEILNRNQIKNNILDFLKNFHENKSQLNILRGIYLFGECGIGKTHFVKQILKEANYDIIYYDASDSRNKNIIENISKHNMSDTNVLSMFHRNKKKIVIIMDEIDGMNSGDKGGINNLIKLIRPKKTKKQRLENYTMNPIICISNNHIDKKITELKKVCETFELKNPTTQQIESIINELFTTITKTDKKSLLHFIGFDLRKLIFIHRLYKKDTQIFEKNIFKNIKKISSFNENTKDLTRNLLKNKYNIHQHNEIISETDRTSLSLLFHENICEVLNNKNPKENINFYLKILDNFCFSDYIDRITFQKQLWIFNEMTSLIKNFYNNKILHEELENKNKKAPPSTIRFTKVLTKYSTEYNNSVFIDSLCQKLNLDKSDVMLFFETLQQNNTLEDIGAQMEQYEINNKDVNRIYRFLDNIKEVKV